MTPPPTPQEYRSGGSDSASPPPLEERHFQFFLLFSVPPPTSPPRFPLAFRHELSQVLQTLTPVSGGSRSQPNSPCAVLVSIRVTESGRKEGCHPSGGGSQLPTLGILGFPSSRLPQCDILRQRRKAEWGKGWGDWCLNQSQESKALEEQTQTWHQRSPGEHLQGCYGWTSGKLSPCGPEWDPSMGILLDFDSSGQWPALEGEGREGKAMILGSGRGIVRGCAKL